MNDIDWHIIQRMLIDAPRFDTDSPEEKKKKSTTINLSEQTSDDFLKNIPL